MEDYDFWTGWTLPGEEIPEPKCECGADKVMDTTNQKHLHSRWCPAYKDDSKTEDGVKK